MSVVSPQRAPRRTAALAFLALTLGAAHAASAPAPPSETVALRAGTIHLVEDGVVLRGGATILITDGTIRAVGADVEVPPHAQLVDYGPDAVIVPGLVAPFSPYALGSPSARSASPGTRGVDGFDTYGSYASALAGGVTSAYVMPAEGRLIAGIGALVKLAGEEGEGRILNAEAAIHGAVDESARQTPGYWEPPIPSTVDVGLGYAERQLPRSTMGAVLALSELLDAAGSDDARRRAEELYGVYAVADFTRLMEQGLPWCMAASEPNEIRAMLALASERGLSLILDKASRAGGLAEEIAAAGAAVVFRVPYVPNTEARDRGKGRDDRWMELDVPAALVKQGVRVAIAGSSPADLLFSASLAARGGLPQAAALRAITLTPAELFGAAERVGSLSVGKDADLCVLSGEPFAGFAPGVLATWVGGELAWSAHTVDATVIEVDELFVGDDEVLRPGQLLMRDGKIVEVGAQVGRPLGARVVRGRACMPGMIDAFGHLGLERANKVPSVGFELAEIVGPGDEVDRRVARHGITTVVLTPRGASGSGAPVMAYKPAAADFDGLIVRDPVAVRVEWEDDNRLESGDDVRKLLDKAKDYRDKWLEYEAAMAAWTPPPPEPPEEKDAEAEEEDDDEEKKKDEDEEDGKKSKKKKKGDEELEPDPITGVWHAEVEPGEGDPIALKLRLLFAAAQGSGDVEGNLRCAAVSIDLVQVKGYWNREAEELRLRGLGSAGWVELTAGPKDGHLVGTLSNGPLELAFDAERVSREYVVARRSERRAEKEPDAPKPPKGTPKEPKLDSKLEPLRAAFEGRVAIVVEVNREDEILECVETFERYGIRPVLLGARDAHHVAERLAGRVRGVLLEAEVRVHERDRGTNDRTPYADLQGAGVPVAFRSGAEEGAIDLPLAAAYAIANGMSPSGALRALTSDAAAMMSIGKRVGALRRGYDADVLLLDGAPLAPPTSVVRTWVNGVEVY